MSSVNRCIFIGRLAADPEARTTQTGAKVCNFRLAVSEKWTEKASGEKKESTTWVPVVVWGPLANVAEAYLKKGSQCYIEGKFSVRKWTDQSGADRYSTEVVLNGFNSSLVLLGGNHEKPKGNYADKEVPWDDAPAGDFDDFGDKVPW